MDAESEADTQRAEAWRAEANVKREGPGSHEPDWARSGERCMTEAVIEKKLPARRDVPVGDTWDLASLFSSDAEWEAALAEWEKMLPGFGAFAGTLA